VLRVVSATLVDARVVQRLGDQLGDEAANELGDRHP